MGSIQQAIRYNGSRWLPPPSGLTKINVDTTLSKNEARTSSLGGEEKFLGASALVADGITNTEIIKLIMCRVGLALASELVLQRFRLASDNLNVIRSLKEGSLSTYGYIVQEIKARPSDFQIVDCVHEG